MKRLFLCLLAFCSFACDRTLGPPADVLPEKTMVALLVDLHVAEAKVKNLQVSADSAKHVFSIYEVQIFDKYNVSTEKYLHSYEYYVDNHRLMSRVHQAVLDTLVERQRKAELLPPPQKGPPANLDSLRKAGAKPDSVQDSSRAQTKL